jgi:hypothetical protein
MTVSRNKRWKRKIRRARWLRLKRMYLAHGWVEVYMNSLVPGSFGETQQHELGWKPMTTPKQCNGCRAFRTYHFKVHNSNFFGE